MSERLLQVRYMDLSAEIRSLADDNLKVSSATLGGPYNALLRSPDMAWCAFDFLDCLRFRTTKNRRLSEFAILIQETAMRFRYVRSAWALMLACDKANGPQAN